MISYSNGEFIPTKEVALPVFDDLVGTVRGYRIFTMGKTVNQRLFRLDDHVQRLVIHAERISMDIPHSASEIRQLIIDTIEKNSGESGEFTLLAFYSGGPANLSKVGPAQKAKFYILISPDSPPPKDWYEQGISLATFPHQRQFPTIKLFNYVGGVVAHQTAVQKMNAQEGLFLSPGDNDTILEGTTFSFFAVDSHGSISTHPEDGTILESITRKVIVELAENNGIPCQEVPIKISNLNSISEAFLASCNRGIVPIVQIDDKTIGDGKPGGITAKITELLDDIQNLN